VSGAARPRGDSASAAAGGDELQHPEDLGAVADHLAIACLAPPQDAVAIDDERRPVGDVPILVEHAVGTNGGPVDVAQEWEGQARGPRKRFVARWTVTTDGEHASPARRDLAGDLAQVAQLGPSDAAEVVTVEDEHDILTPEIAQRHRASRRRRETDIRGDLAEAKRRHGGESVRHPPSGRALQQRADARNEDDGQEHGGSDHVRVTRDNRHTAHSEQEARR
jgi:hypothetical protein